MDENKIRLIYNYLHFGTKVLSDIEKKEIKETINTFVIVGA